MIDTELAMAVSVRSWPDQLRRFLADHGGARIRLTAMSPADLEREGFDVLLIDDVCSYLTPTLVSAVKRRNAAVLGVYDPSEYPDGKDRLLECGVSDVVDARADPDEFLELIGRVRLLAPDEVPETVRQASKSKPGALILFVGPGGGVGVTEISAAVAHSLERRRGQCALVDLDLTAASVAQRFDLDPHPNLLTAIDGVEAPARDTLLVRSGELSVLPGAPAGSHLGSLRPHHLAAVIDRLRSDHRTVVVDAGSPSEPFGGALGQLVRDANQVVVVGSGSPVGVGRLLRWAGRAGRVVDLMINRAPRDSFRRGEILDEVARALTPRSLAFIPEDPAVVDAAWEGRPLRRGRFVRAVDRWVGTYAAGILS